MVNLELLRKYSSEHKKAQKKSNTLEEELKKAKDKLVAVEKKLANDCQAHTDSLDIALLKVNSSRDRINKALQELVELQKFAHDPIYKHVFDRGYNLDGDTYMR